MSGLRIIEVSPDISRCTNTSTYSARSRQFSCSSRAWVIEILLEDELFWMIDFSSGLWTGSGSVSISVTKVSAVRMYSFFLLAVEIKCWSLVGIA
jgi:hypothetical protein